MLIGIGCAVRAGLAEPASHSPRAVRPTSRPSTAGCLRGTAHEEAIQQTIRQVFGPRHAATAIRVAQCESGSRGTAAAKGQFRGLFQMGRKARRLYGDGRCAEQQTQAAYLYFVAEGRRWTPWAPCLRRKRSKH